MDSVIAFTSFSRVGLVRSDGSEETYPELKHLIQSAPPRTGEDPADPESQKSWQWGPVLPSGDAMIVTSYEETAIERIVVGDLRTRIWLLDFATQRLVPILEGNRPSGYTTCAGVLPQGERLIASAIIDGEQRLFLTNGDVRSDRLEYEPLTAPGEGFHYGVDVSPDGTSLACHVTGGKYAGVDGKPTIPPYPSYSIHRIDLVSRSRTVLYGDDNHLYFAPVFAPDGVRVAFLDCEMKADPAHFWAKLCVLPVFLEEEPPTSATYRAATPLFTEPTHWFGTSHGSAEHRGGGSNSTSWTPDGDYITFTRRIPGSHPDCRYDASRPDHQELVYAPENARGGTQLCYISPDAEQVVEITTAEEGKWDFRAAVSGAAGSLAFARYSVGDPTELWMCAAMGGNEVKLTAGYDGHGADHPRWIPEALLDAVRRKS